MDAKKYILFFLILFMALITGCGGGGASDVLEDLDPTPDFSPSEDDSLSAMVINTFKDNGIDITNAPEYIEFNDIYGDIEQNDELQEAFIVTNNSGGDRIFQFAIYSVSTGFSILDENKQNLGSYNQIEIADGETRTFYLQFNAWVFGSQTSYIHITADVEGYIRLPMRASVTGPADFKIIPTGYFCSDDDAPSVDYLDFYKVAYSQTRTLGFKICNTGGENIKITSATIANDDDVLQSEALSSNAFEDYIWTVSDEINDSFSFGETPNQTKSFQEPVLVDYSGTIDDPASSYDVGVYLTGKPVQNILIEAGKILRLDVDFSPTLDAEASDGYLYNAMSVNAVLKLNTSLGTIRIPLVGATGGVEPILEMYYRLSDDDTWKPIDLYSDGAAIYFGTVDIFLDWVSSNASTVQIKVVNAGSGSKDLEFYGGSINGFFEYYWEDGKNLQFPLQLAAGEENEFMIRYLPSSSVSADEEFEASWDFGQFYFQHSGGNGPQNKMTLVGEQDEGYAVQLYYGGTKLEREYAENSYQNICLVSTDSSNPTEATFKVENNNKEDNMSVSWSFSQGEDLTATPTQGSLTVAPGDSESFTISYVASSDSVGQMISGTLNVETTFPDKESEYASLTSDLLTRNFEVPIQAMASDSGESNLCNTGVLGDEDSTYATFVIDRVTMVMTDLIESAHNPPPFRFHIPLELNREQGTVRIYDDINLQFKEEELNPVKAIRSYTHQATNIKGCAPLPTNPYRLEYKKGSWTGRGIECSDDGDGTISYTTPEGEKITFDSDTACMPTNGGEEYVDENGVTWMVVYHEFVKFENCDVQYYGKIATFAYRPDVEEVGDVFRQAEESPNESESYYESVYGAYRYGSFITFLDETKCAGQDYGPSSVSTITDPDEVKDCYKSLASKSSATRKDGFVNECSYFVFAIEGGEEPSDVNSANPDYDSWNGFGTYEPHVDDDGVTHETKYDLTIHNIHIEAFVLGAGDRAIFFSHPGHLVYSDMYVTITTKRVADEADMDDGDWQKRIATNTRFHLDKNQIYLKDGERYDTAKFWTDDGINEEFSNVVDDSKLAHSGVNYGGYGKGNFRYWEGNPDSNRIVFAGWPVNFDEHNLLLMVGIGAFNGKGNTAPSFAKADAATGQGKPLYFSFHGCLLPGEVNENQGCFDYHLDDGVMDDGTLVIDEYSDLSVGILPEGYVDAADCSNLADPGFADPENSDYDVYEYMACIDYKIIPDFDRDRYKNYYDNANKLDFGYDPYGSSTCGYGN